MEEIILEKIEVLKEAYPFNKNIFTYNEESHLFEDSEGSVYTVLSEDEGYDYFINWCDSIQEDIEYELEKKGFEYLINCIDWGKYFEYTNIIDLDFNEVYHNKKIYYIREE